MIPARSLGTPDEVAAAVAFLFSAGRGLHHPAGDLGKRRASLMKRVVVTGMAALTPIGSDWNTIAARLEERRSGIRTMREWEILRQD